MTTGKSIALTRQTFVGNVISLLFNMLSRLKFVNFTSYFFHLFVSIALPYIDIQLLLVGVTNDRTLKLASSLCFV